MFVEWRLKIPRTRLLPASEMNVENALSYFLSIKLTFLIFLLFWIVISIIFGQEWIRNIGLSSQSNEIKIIIEYMW